MVKPVMWKGNLIGYRYTKSGIWTCNHVGCLKVYETLFEGVVKCRRCGACAIRTLGTTDYLTEPEYTAFPSSVKPWTDASRRH